MATHADLVIASRAEEIARAREWVTQYARAEGFEAKDVRNFALVISEACANVIEHAYDREPDLPIKLNLMIDDQQLVLLIHDVGRKFDVARYQAPDLDEPHEGGYGVFIIRSLMDEVEYDTSAPEGTTLKLVKHRSPAAC